MKVIFLNPPNTDTHSYIARSADRWPHRVERGNRFKKKMFPKYPLYLMYGAAVVEQSGHEVIAIDAAERDYTHKKTLDLIKNFSPDVVVMEISEPSRESDLKMADMIKPLGVHICLIGAHATIYDEEIIKASNAIDSIARGEYYHSLKELIDNLASGKSPGQVKGITYRENGAARQNPNRPILKNLDELPYPARHLLDPRRYLMGHYTYAPQLLMTTSIGCPYQCIFCVWPKNLYQGKFRIRKPVEVVKEMQVLIDKYGAKEIYFDDDLFNITEKRVHEVCDAIIEAKIKIPWITEVRCDNLSEESLKKMKQAGCVKLLFGVESGVQRILDNAKKKMTVEQIQKAFRMAHKIGIKTHAAFMFGLPGETEETIDQTIRFARNLNPDTIQCSIALPYPGTEFYEMARKNGSLKVNQWIDFDGELCGAVEYENLSKEKIRSSINRMYREMYINPRYISKLIFGIRSVSDIKRLVNLGISGLRRFS